MKLTLFSVDEANQMATEIRPDLERLVRVKRDLDRLQRRIDVLSLASSGAAPGNPDAQELRRLVQRRNAFTEDMKRSLHAIQSRGPVVKDLARGLVDFYSIAGDRLIFLCWQLDEPEVAYWHSLEGGFGGRRPLQGTEHE